MKLCSLILETLKIWIRWSQKKFDGFSMIIELIVVSWSRNSLIVQTKLNLIYFGANISAKTMLKLTVHLSWNWSIGGCWITSKICWLLYFPLKWFWAVICCIPCAFCFLCFDVVLTIEAKYDEYCYTVTFLFEREWWLSYLLGNLVWVYDDTRLYMLFALVLLCQPIIFHEYFYTKSVSIYCCGGIECWLELLHSQFKQLVT